MGPRGRWRDPDKALMSHGAERFFKWDSHVQLALAGLLGAAVVVALVISWVHR